jgi:hypothetical protein
MGGVMLTRIIVVAVIASLAVVAISPIIYERIVGVGVMRASNRNKRVKNLPKRRPAAEAYIVGLHPESEEPSVVVPIYSVNDIYASVGVGQKEFSEWQGKYGVGTFGRTGEGVLFVPNYPVLSKIAWMGIDTIDLSSAETSMLIDECTKAKNMSVNAAAGTELEALIQLARRALDAGGTVRFGLP